MSAPNSGWPISASAGRWSHFYDLPVPICRAVLSGALGEKPRRGLPSLAGFSVSRPQAKRILARFPDVSEVILDFTGVSDIGQAFGDEIFRVFQNDHPDTMLVAAGANENIKRMIDYVKSAAAPTSPPAT
jgi:hypothetical protein